MNEGIYMSPDLTIKQKLLKLNHDNPYKRHFGIRRTYNLIKYKYCWDRFYYDVEEYIISCDVYQHNKVKHYPIYGELQSIKAPKTL